jgi:hypothetical protein
MYMTLLQRISTSPKFPANSPSTNSSAPLNYKQSIVGTQNMLKKTLIKDLKVHVRVNRHEKPLVLHAPFQLYHDRSARQSVEKGFRIHDLVREWRLVSGRRGMQ